MIRSALNAIVLLLALICLSNTVEAQKTYALAVGGGVSLPVGALADTQDPGFNGMLGLALGAPELPIGIRFDGLYNRFPAPKTDAAQPVSNPYRLRVMALLGNLIYALPGSSVKTYVVAGGGVYNTRLDVAGSKSENDPGLNAGAGLTFRLGPIASFVEARYHYIRRQPENGGLIHFVPVTVGLLF
jgi:Outer membrane protein beta-barrel domain